jgi:hypothetical protein
LSDEQAVRAGREAMGRWPAFPWYDSKDDAVRRIDLAPPKLREPGERTSEGVAGSFLKTLGWLALGAALAGLIAALLWALGKWRRGDEEPAESGAAEVDDESRRSEALPALAARKRADLLDEARRLYEAGRYAEAIVYLFSYQLVRLDKQQLLHLAQGKTNRQYLRELGPRASLRQLLEQTMVVFEDAFFGNFAIDRARFESCWRRLDEFESLAMEGTG